MSETLIFMKIFFFVFIFLNFTQIFGQNFDQKEVRFWDLSKTFNLSGTFTSPKGLKNYPVAVLISGSGQTDRDETIGKHKIFKGLAEYLSNNGIGVLRYDDRGGFKSEGPKTVNSTTQELALDVVAAVKFIEKELKIKQIGLIGHSEGGGIGPIVASKVKNLDFLVSLAGPGVSGREILIQQNKDIYLEAGVPLEHVEHFIKDFFEPMLSDVVLERDSTSKANNIKKLGENYQKKYKAENFVLGMTTNSANIPLIMKQLNNPWFMSFIKYDPQKYWKKIKIRTLALNGDLDIQVNAKVNLTAIENQKNKHIKTKILKNHNHLFQIAKTGNLQEYYKLNEGISKETLTEIKNFIIEK
ncbi:Serine aminopeptidase, S33 [Spirosomataceae bacterium]